MEGGQFDNNQFNQLINNNQPSTGGDGFNNFSQNSNGHNRTKREKATSLAILLVAVVVVFFAYFQLASNLNQPFLKFFDTAGSADSDETCPDGNCQPDDTQSLLVDTDGDGLSDYEELSIYKTSPYLEDSDSDGMSDKYEAEMGYDPNCAGTEPCFASDVSGDDQAGEAPIFSGTMPSPEMTELNVATIREVFITSGMPREEVDQLTDEEILLLYNRLATQTPVEQTTESGPAEQVDLDIDINSMADLQNLTGAQIRALLINQGMPESDLATISDEDLKTMFLDKLKEQANN